MAERADGSQVGDAFTLWSAIRSDLWHSCHLWDKRPDARRVVFAVQRVLLVPHVRAVVYFRLSSWAFHHRALRWLAYLIRARVVRVAGADLHPGATIGPGFNLVHSVGVVIGKDVIAGRDLVVLQNVTLGDDGRQPGQPVLGNHVVLGAGAAVLGPISIGDRATVGANSVVLDNVPAGRTAVGSPARVVA